MVQINNGETIQEVVKGARLQAGRDLIPSTLTNQVVPVMECNPILLRYCNIVKTGYSAAGNATVFTTDATKDTYIVAASLSQSKLVTDSQAQLALNVTLADGSGGTILQIAGITLNAEIANVAISFPRPILLKRNTAVTLAKTAANGSAAATVIGYTVQDQS